MRRAAKISLSSAVLSTGLIASPAFAQEHFAEPGTLSIAAERLLGIGYSRTRMELDDEDATLKQVRGVLLPDWGLGVDYFPIKGLSLGGALGLSTLSDTWAEEGPDNKDSQLRFNLGLRAGYAIMFSDTVGFWPRGGFGYQMQRMKQEFGDLETSVRLGAITFDVDANLVLAPVPHVGFLLGPGFDIALMANGKQETTGAGVDGDEVDFDKVSWMSVGGYAGILVWF